MNKRILSWLLIFAYIVALFFVPKKVMLIMIIIPLGLSTLKSLFGPNEALQELEKLESSEELERKNIVKLGVEVRANSQRLKEMMGR